MTTLFDAMLSAARLVQALRSGTADSGSTTTLVDADRFEADDYFNGGTLFIQSGDNDNTAQAVSDFANSTGTLTFAALSDAIVAGVRYSATQINREMFVQAVNTALQDIGNVTNVDDSSLTVVDNQTEYALPAGVYNVVRVEVAGGASADYNYQTVYNWREINGSLYFDDELGFSAGNKIRIFYNAPHAEVSSDSDTITDAIHPSRLAWTAAFYLALALTQFPDNSDPNLTSLLSFTQAQMTVSAAQHPVRKMVRDPILGSY